MAIFASVAELGWEDITLTLHHAPLLLATIFLSGCVRRSGGICSGPPGLIELGDALGEGFATSTFWLHLYRLGIY